MSILVDEDDFRARLEVAHDSVRRAIDQYKQILLIYGTCPSMNLVDKLQRLCDQILTYEQPKPIIAMVSWASSGIKCEACGSEDIDVEDLGESTRADYCICNTCGNTNQMLFKEV